MPPLAKAASQITVGSNSLTLAGSSLGKFLAWARTLLLFLFLFWALLATAGAAAPGLIGPPLAITSRLRRSASFMTTSFLVYLPPMTPPEIDVWMREGARTIRARAGGKKSMVLEFWMSAGPP